ncbi:hypothetical protein BC939DRAFT_504843 [Gamsiella multidivaricata]|uniref:uncharacterized protein n=1 Tax=Gamsiella multidivaricata TaxID=101098 RepID=UPI002220551D|nr:uncharacterized protein BC939DRAFT_504843 [Gamsiella multidivaricata]KAG0368821.1 hypothetical protein BGZ54_001075 [Gamsiella multidivaricata]KAI7820624.1 hypothetical protein BC939DRAFT_504843 [Gamsiella multidivaricata]
MPKVVKGFLGRSRALEHIHTINPSKKRNACNHNTRGSKNDSADNLNNFSGSDGGVVTFSNAEIGDPRQWKAPTDDSTLTSMHDDYEQFKRGLQVIVTAEGVPRKVQKHASKILSRLRRLVFLAYARKHAVRTAPRNNVRNEANRSSKGSRRDNNTNGSEDSSIGNLIGLYNNDGGVATSSDAGIDDPRQWRASAELDISPFFSTKSYCHWDHWSFVKHCNSTLDTKEGGYKEFRRGLEVLSVADSVPLKIQQHAKKILRRCGQLKFITYARERAVRVSNEEAIEASKRAFQVLAQAAISNEHSWQPLLE